MPGVYNIGDRVDLIANFSCTGVPTDPTTVAVQWGRSGASPTNTWVYNTDAQIARVSAGTFSAAVFITASMTGIFYYRFSGTTACHAASASYFEVKGDWLL